MQRSARPSILRGELARELGPSFRVVRRATERHRKPFGGSQDFVWILARRKTRQA